MPYVIWNVGGKEYRLRLTTLNAMQVEKQLGMGLTEAIEHLTDITVVITLLWGAMQPYNHGTGLRDVCDLYDEYLASGGDAVKIVDVLVELLAQAGIGDKAGSSEKNVESQAEDVFSKA